MKKVKVFKILLLSLGGGVILTAVCGLVVVASWTDQSSSKKILEKAKLKLENSLIDGSTLDPDGSISHTNKDEIIRLIKNIINNRDIDVEIHC